MIRIEPPEINRIETNYKETIHSSISFKFYFSPDMFRTFIFWTFATIVASNPTGINFTEMTSTTGIIFVPFTKVQLSYKEWKLVYYYDLNKYYEEITIIKNFYFRLTSICDQASEAGQEFANSCHLATSHAKYHLDKITEGKSIIGSYNTIKSRNKRSPFDIVGTVAHSLFGVLDQEDAERYNMEINKLKTD